MKCSGTSAPSRPASTSMLLLAAVFSAAFTSGTAAACGQYLPDTDVPGANMPGSPTFEASPDACVALCQSTPTCSAIITFPNGACFLKSVDVDTVQPFARAGMTSYLLCPDPEPTCGVLMPDTDIPGANMPGSPTFEAGPAACQALCQATATCNAYIIFPNGACFLKSVDVDTVEPIPRAGMSSYLFCGGGGPPPAQCDPSKPDGFLDCPESGEGCVARVCNADGTCGTAPVPDGSECECTDAGCACACQGLPDPELGDDCFTNICNGGQCEVKRAADGEPCTTDRVPGGGFCFIDGDINQFAGCGCGSCEGYEIEGDPQCYDILCSVGVCYDIESPSAFIPGICAGDNYSICHRSSAGGSPRYTCLGDGECVEGNVQACGPPEASSCQAFTCSIEPGATKGTCVCE